MAYRKILVPLAGTARDGYALKAAFHVATAFGSHVAGLYVRPDPTTPVAYLGENVSGAIIQELIDAARAAAKRAAGVAQAALQAAAKDAGAPLRALSEVSAGLGASFHIRDGAPDDVAADEARLSDLCVFDSPPDDNDSAMRPSLESALLDGRKPLLIVPRQWRDIVSAKVAIGWDGSACAAHAVAAAIPLLKRAASVEILSVGHWPVDTTQMDRMRDYLRLHDIRPIEHGIHPGDEETGHALLDAAERLGAGLLVLGGYGHSKLRELVLGGVTRHVLANAHLPIFMAH